MPSESPPECVRMSMTEFRDNVEVLSGLPVSRRATAALVAVFRSPDPSLLAARAALPGPRDRRGLGWRHEDHREVAGDVAGLHALALMGPDALACPRCSIARADSPDGCSRVPFRSRRREAATGPCVRSPSVSSGAA